MKLLTKQHIMKKIGAQLIFALLAVVLIQACGPSEAEKQAQEQARLDSLRQVQQMEIDRQMAELAAKEAEEEQQRQIEEEESMSFSEDGEYAVQVGAFRSETKANNFLADWSDRDYPNAYVVKVGEEEYGDVWFRLRVGYFDTKEAAEKLGVELAQEINSSYWVSKVR